MDGIIYLKENEIYFHTGFLDENLTIPIIDTYIYLGKDSEHGHIFEDVDNKIISIHKNN